ncbi:MAG: glutamate--tRNA ligase [Polyangiaceae bacterium]|nr:glutamate--tRNA ligase [Polyangiaceae bacterium]
MAPPPEPPLGAPGPGGAARADSGVAPRVRFAPSPSGYLHIGGARTALFNWLWARRQGGTFVLRIEDTDQERSSVESVRAILDALRWLGLDWDEGPEAGGSHGPYFQSERRARYREVADAMVEAGTAYRCYATKEELEQARAELKARDPKAQFVYPGWWRDRRDWPDGKPWVYRFKTPRTGATDFDDLVFGRVSTPNDAQQDFVLMRSDGFPLYNFSCVIDDHDMGITLVARGRDHIGNTPQQVLLYEALGWPAPQLAHLPMMLSAKGEKLSKRHAAVSVSEYRDRGYTAMGVLNYLARFGWSHGDQEIFARDELVAAFDWASVNRADGKFDEKKFADVAFEHLKQPRLTSDAEYVERVRPFLAARGLDADEPTLCAALPLIRERARTLADAAHHLDFYFREPPELDPAAAKVLTPQSAELLEGLAAALTAVEPWEGAAIDEAIRAWVEARGVSLKDVAQPARVSLSGRTASPALHDVMAVLGRARALARLRHGATLAREAAAARAPG